MVQTKKMKLVVEIEIDVPVDIVQDKSRIKAVEEGLGRSISKGLYDQGVSFQIKKIGSKIASSLTGRVLSTLLSRSKTLTRWLFVSAM